MINPVKEEIEKCLDVLRKGGTILYPTDTVWGLGCDATNEDAVKKIFALKKRVESKSMIVLLDTENRLSSYVRDIPEIAYDLIGFSEKPLTLIFDEAKNLAAGVIAEDGSVGIRITKDDFCRQLIERLRKPIVSSSANISGHPTPENFAGIDAAIIKGVDYVVNLRQDEITNAAPSSIVRLRKNGTIQIIRK